MAHLHGKFIWFELITDDADRAKGFYGELFGWKARPMPMGPGMTYDILAAGEKDIGGIAAAQGRPAHWHSYVSVADVDATARSITAAGGKLVSPAFDVPGVGRMAAVADPQGAILSIMRSSEGDAPDAPAAVGQVMWNELWTSDANAALAFYEKTLGFAHKDMDMGPAGIYRVLTASGADRGGLMPSSLPTAPDRKAPPMWLPYVRVVDTDATVGKAKKLGAKVVAEASDIPNVGRFAILADPLGAVVAVMKPAM